MLFFEGVPLWHASASTGKPLKPTDLPLLRAAIEDIFRGVGEAETDIEQRGGIAFHIRRRTRPEERPHIKPHPMRSDY